MTPDGLRLYFVTDQLPGGFGGKDIWYVDRLEEKWGQPQNAGELINTAGDEMFPYVRENGEFYFASNGHYGFGGLDLYKVGNVAGKEVIVHLPLNRERRTVCLLRDEAVETIIFIVLVLYRNN